MTYGQWLIYLGVFYAGGFFAANDDVFGACYIPFVAVVLVTLGYGVVKLLFGV